MKIETHRRIESTESGPEHRSPLYDWSHIPPDPKQQAKINEREINTSTCRRYLDYLQANIPR